MYQHIQLAAGRWQQFTLLEQMAHIGSEVDRFLNARARNRVDDSQRAFERALELIELTLVDPKHRSRLKEIARMREALLDFFRGTNYFNSTATAWQNYFNHFAYAARRNC